MKTRSAIRDSMIEDCDEVEHHQKTLQAKGNDRAATDALDNQKKAVIIVYGHAINIMSKGQGIRVNEAGEAVRNTSTGDFLRR